MASDGQPIHSRFDLASSPSAVRWSRKHASDVLAAWAVQESVANDALLIVSELVSNAVQHAGKPSDDDADGRLNVAVCSLFLWLTGRGLTIAVHDLEMRPPVRRSASLNAEGGRGLALVEALSDRWGYSYPAPSPGKLVWARLTLATSQEVPDGQSRLGHFTEPLANDVAAVMGA